MVKVNRKNRIDLLTKSEKRILMAIKFLDFPSKQEIVKDTEFSQKKVYYTLQNMIKNGIIKEKPHLGNQKFKLYSSIAITEVEKFWGEFLK